MSEWRPSIILVGNPAALPPTRFDHLECRYILEAVDGAEAAFARVRSGVAAELVFVVSALVDMPLRKFCDALAANAGETGPPALLVAEEALDEGDVPNYVAGEIQLLSVGASDLVFQFQVRNAVHRRRRRVKTESRIEELRGKLALADDVLVGCLVRGSTYKDDDSGSHVERVREYSALLARLCGMSESGVAMIARASMLHDLGKLSIPDSILQKSDALVEWEWEFIKGHCVEGAAILGDPGESRLLKTTRNVILYHHERWDGSGYPEGLSGEQIPVEARIVGIADVFDALTSDMPYRKGWDTWDAVDHIRENAENHFDPDLVRLFLNNIVDFIGIRERMADIVVNEQYLGPAVE